MIPNVTSQEVKNENLASRRAANVRATIQLSKQQQCQTQQQCPFTLSRKKQKQNITHDINFHIWVGVGGWGWEGVGSITHLARCPGESLQAIAKAVLATPASAAGRRNTLGRALGDLTLDAGPTYRHHGIDIYCTHGEN